jgi:homoserine dehydrogenase
VSEALKRGKHVVTANKKMLASHFSELYKLQENYNVSLLYEGSACGSIPIIRSLEEYFDNEELDGVSGIFNGTTNYILTKTINEKLSYAEALKQAQQNGFAESDATNDVEGYDAKFKTVIITLHAYGIILKEENVLNIGITTLDNNDIRFASEKGYKIKLISLIKRLDIGLVTAFVLPQFIRNNRQLSNVDNEYNGVIVEGKFSGEQFLQGKGAGSLPTGAAVLSDISALSFGYKYEFKKRKQNKGMCFTNDVLLKIYLRYNSEEELREFKFDKIEEHYIGDKYKYVIGKLNLQEIFSKRELIIKKGLFVSVLNDSIFSVVPNKNNS